MIETAFYTRNLDGPDTPLGSIRLTFTSADGEQIEFIGDEVTVLHSLGLIPVLAEVREGVHQPVTLAQAPAYWLRNIAAEFTNAYQRAEVITDDDKDPNALDTVPVADAPTTR